MCKAVSNALGLTPKMPAMPTIPAPPPAPPPAPTVPTKVAADAPIPEEAATPPSQSPAAQAAGEAARKQAARQRGRATTILTGPMGLVGTEAVARPTATKVLLGG